MALLDRYKPYVFPPCIIYGLFNPESKKFFYVGRTTDTCCRRLSNHISEAKNKRSDKDILIIDLLSRGKKPTIRILKIKKYPNYKFAAMKIHESKWIRKLLSEGHPLTNKQLIKYDKELVNGKIVIKNK